MFNTIETLIKMRLKLYTIILLSTLALSCNQKKTKDISQETPQETPVQTPPSFQNKGHELVYNMVQNVGTLEALHQKKDVSYTYTYQTPDGKTDISNEKYIFNGELSYGHYQQHERTFPKLKGPITQGYDGNTYWLKHNDTLIKDEKLLKRVAFNRPTNFYWFAMFQKLLDPGLTYEYLGETTLNAISYDIVKVSFTSQNNTPTDIYQLYINKHTLYVDQFLFTVADFGVMDTPFLMQVAYETIDGLWIPTRRKYKRSTWKAAIDDAPWTKVTWSNITFNNGLNKRDFSPQ
jgi:hypothetical protein